MSNNQRDGIHRQAVHRGRVAYEPNSLGGGCPFQAGAKGFVSFPQPLDGEKLRGKPEKFADHYTQATLFYDSQTAVEQAHIVGGFRFELSKLTVPAIRARMVASLVNVSPQLAAQVADGLGMPLPAALPRALEAPNAPEVTASAALSLTALPGDGGIRTRRVALLAAHGVMGAPLLSAQAALQAAGAVSVVIAPRLGALVTADNEAVEATASFENSPPVLFDTVLLPDSEAGVKALLRHGQAVDFVAMQFRHGKTLRALGASKAFAATVPLLVDQLPGKRMGTTAQCLSAGARKRIDPTPRARRQGRGTYGRWRRRTTSACPSTLYVQVVWWWVRSNPDIHSFRFAAPMLELNTPTTDRLN